MSTLTAQPAPVADRASEHAHARRWWVLALLATAQLMVVLDATIVNIALPSAQRGLHFSNADRQWIVTAYALAFGSLLLLGGRLSDLYGRRRAFLVGVAGFAAASALGGAATSFEMLVLARGLQGAFGALLAPASLALLTTTFQDPAERAKAFAVNGAIGGAGGGVGLLLGGVLTEYLDWRWCLFVNLFIAAIGLVGGVTLLDGRRDEHHVRLDVPGMVVSFAGLFALVYGFSRAATDGWSDLGTIVSLIAGVVLMIAFVWIENVVAAPLLPMRILLHSARGGAYLTLFFAAAGIFSVFLFLTYYMQGSLGYSPVQTGIGFLPLIGISVVAASLTTTRLMPRFGPLWIMPTGQVIGAVGLVMLTQIGTNSSYAGGVLPALLVVGAGLGASFSAGFEVGTRGVATHDAGIASSMVNTTQQVGGSIATAFLNTIAASSLASYLRSHGSDAESVAKATVHSYSVSFWWSAGFFLVGAVVSAFVLRGMRGAGAGLPQAGS